MLKNKIYNYFFNEILRNFIIILFTFTAIAWVVRAVNFLDLMVEDGYGSSVYFKYSLLNIASIASRFIPLAFLLSLTISILKFERQQELLILWTTGLSKIKIVNIFLLIGLFITLFQLLLSAFINPLLLNESRSLLRDNSSLQINTVLRSNDFSDAFKNLTFYVESKNTNDELINIFIKDVGGNLNTISAKKDENKNSTIIAKKGFVDNDKLILFDGIIQSIQPNNKIKNIQFEKTELSLGKISSRTIKQPKIQETSSSSLIKCFLKKNNSLVIDSCTENYKIEVTQTLSRRLGMPLYIPLISIIISLLLINKKKGKYNFLKKYLLFILTFIILIFAEILLKFTGMSLYALSFYFLLPISISFFFYIYLFKRIVNERV
jgi:lipopolysaccharide export system permease protein|tara:strand:+ start:1127 stop:2260 length:1134 start_codon:yes stop_codon:yes gene_type:complete